MYRRTARRGKGEDESEDGTDGNGEEEQDDGAMVEKGFRDVGKEDAVRVEVDVLSRVL